MTILNLLINLKSHKKREIDIMFPDIMQGKVRDTTLKYSYQKINLNLIKLLDLTTSLQGNIGNRVT